MNPLGGLLSSNAPECTRATIVNRLFRQMRSRQAKCASMDALPRTLTPDINTNTNTNTNTYIQIKDVKLAGRVCQQDQSSSTYSNLWNPCHQYKYTGTNTNTQVQLLQLLQMHKQMKEHEPKFRWKFYSLVKGIFC